MKFKNFIRSVIFYISVPKCVSCGERLLKSEKTMCPRCKREFDEAKLFACSVCGDPYYQCFCGNEFLESHYIKKVIKVYKYFPGEERASNYLIYNLKKENRYDVLEFLKSEIAASIENKDIKLDNFIITNVPRRAKSIKKYGYDHSKLLAKELAKTLGIPFVPLLKSKAKRDQKQSRGREERFKNACFDYRKNAQDLNGKNVILLDDIITSGASMSAASMLLHGIGAGKIIAACIAIAYKDDYVPTPLKKNIDFHL